VLCRQGGVSVLAATDGAEVGSHGSWCQSFALSPDLRTAFVADGGSQDLLRRYDLESGEVRGEVELESGAINRVAVSPDGTLLAAVGCKRFQLLAADTFEVLATDAQRALSSGAFALAFSPCGRSLVYSAGRVLFVWDVPTAREVTRLQLGSKYFMDAAFTPDGAPAHHGEQGRRGPHVGHCDMGVRAVIRVGRRAACARWAIAPDGARAAVAGDSGRVVVWDLDV